MNNLQGNRFNHITTHAQICNTVAQWLTEFEPQNPNWSPKTWDTFKVVCRIHGVAPLLHSTLQASPWVNENIQSWLAEQYRFNALRVTKIHAELKEILALFATHNVPLMPLKGAILSVQSYPDPACRPMADLDFLLRSQDFGAGTHLLNQLGYEPDVAHWKHTEFSKPDNRQVISTTYEHPDNPRNLEIHLYCRETFGGPTVDLTELMWKHSFKGELLGQPAILPKLEVLWLHLLVHSTYHLWQGKGRLIHLIDFVQMTSPLTPLVDKIMPRQQIPASALISLLNTIDARFTYPALAMLKKQFSTILNNKVLSPQQTRVSANFSQWVDSLDLVNTSYLNPNPTGLYLTKALKFSGGRPHEVLQALRFAFLPGLDEIVLDHPRLARSKVPWLAYFLLPLDWIKRLR